MARDTASVLTDNGAIFNVGSRKGRTVIQDELSRLGIVYKRSRPYHPQTCGRIEQFHDTLKRHLVIRRRRGPWQHTSARSTLSSTPATTGARTNQRASSRPLEAFLAREHARPGSPIITEDGELLRELTLDTSSTTSRCPHREQCLETGSNDVSGHHNRGEGGI